MHKRKQANQRLSCSTNKKGLNLTVYAFNFCLCSRYPFKLFVFLKTLDLAVTQNTTFGTFNHIFVIKMDRSKYLVTASFYHKTTECSDVIEKAI